MECFLIGFDGVCHELPPLLEWSFSHGGGKPCDCFEICMAFDAKLINVLERAVRIKTVYEGRTVFFGVVDEFETSACASGALCFVRGRGMQALLLDNEVEAAKYYSAGLEMILEKYVLPYGVTKIRSSVSSAGIPLTVSSGASAWRVLEDYMIFGCDARARFLPDGTLLLGNEGGKSVLIDKNTAISSAIYKRERYGVISEVLVRNKAVGSISRVENEKFIAEGGCARRVLNVPRSTRFDAMRCTGKYQIDASRERERVATLVLSEQFAAFPGDTVRLSGVAAVPEGNYAVLETRCFASARGAGTEIVLRRKEG